MSKAYEVTRCVECKHFRTQKIGLTNNWYDKCVKSGNKIESRDVVMGVIPSWCPLPDMPKKEVE